MSTKNGKLNDGREVYYGDSRISDIGESPIFKSTLSLIRRYYEMVETDSSLSFSSDGGEISKLFLAPRNSKDLAEKRGIYEKIARISYGMLGRTPDFIDSGIAVLPEYAPSLGESADHKIQFAENARAWAKRVRTKDLFISHAIQNPQVDRSQSLHELLQAGEEFAGVWVKEKRDDGVIVKGAKMVNTLAPLADELLVFNLPGMLPADEKFALAFFLPLNTKGLKTICRKTTLHLDRSIKDHPLANLFDEMDAFIVFDDVFVPNENFLVLEDVAASNQFFEKSGLFVHTAHQDEVRGMVKLEFVTALAVRLAEKLGLSGFQRVQEALGGLTVNLEMIRSAVLASELTGHMEGAVYAPDMQKLLAVRANLTKYYDEALRWIAEFSSGSAVGIPMSSQFENPEIGKILASSLTGPLLSAEDRALLLNLAWDVTSEAFGQRQRTYELLHGGNPMFIKGQHWQIADLTAAESMLDEVLGRAKKN